jgi:cysteine/O-acetylserine efflux protein
MEIDYLAFISFVIITTFTPGPNNISSASMGILYGYNASLRYLLGIISGFVLIMLLSGGISTALLFAIPAIESVLHYVGAAYILWLAYHTFKASYSFDEDNQKLLGFSNGFFLQLLNPKVIIYGLTLYSSFLDGITARPFYLVLSALALASVGFCAISTWTLFGASIRKYMGHPRVKQVLNTAFSLLLVFTAVELSGVLEIFS